MTKQEIKLLDVVAILETVPEHRVVRGQVGTIVKDFGRDNFEVEFANRNGETFAMFALNENQLLKLQHMT